MAIFKALKLDLLKDFALHNDQLGVVERTAPSDANIFFKSLMNEPFEVITTVRKEQAQEDILEALEGEIPEALQNDPFYLKWVSDMSEVSKLFCEIQETDRIGFWLGSNRGCSRYHVDNIPFRLLVTYAGKGTEWLPDNAADREAFMRGEANEKIVKDESALQYMNPWDVAVFRGGPKGLLHRTPDEALDDPSVLMRLDHPSFWEKIFEAENEQGTTQEEKGGT